MESISKKMYWTDVVPRLRERFGWKNALSAPQIQKITLNVGLGKGLKDAKFLETVEATLSNITGQKPVQTLARKSIATFKIRQGMAVGMKVTLRGARLWHFLDKLVHVTFARVRDFRGIPLAAVDSHGNFSYGFQEQLSFPEIAADETDVLHGLQVTITTTARSQEKGLALFQALGFPFKK
jgi:large subunit ribosomal protein L5